MSDLNATHNRAVWFDIPVRDLDRAAAFYAGVLAIKVDKVRRRPDDVLRARARQGQRRMPRASGRERGAAAPACCSTSTPKAASATR